MHRVEHLQPKILYSLSDVAQDGDQQNTLGQASLITGEICYYIGSFLRARYKEEEENL